MDRFPRPKPGRAKPYITDLHKLWADALHRLLWRIVGFQQNRAALPERSLVPYIAPRARRDAESGMAYFALYKLLTRLRGSGRW